MSVDRKEKLLSTDSRHTPGSFMCFYKLKCDWKSDKFLNVKNQKVENDPLALRMSIAWDWGWPGKAASTSLHCWVCIPPLCSGRLQMDTLSKSVPCPWNLCLSREPGAGNPLAHTTSELLSFSFRCPHTAVTYVSKVAINVMGSTRDLFKGSG